jgi:hypothetical protein
VVIPKLLRVRDLAPLLLQLLLLLLLQLLLLLLLLLLLQLQLLLLLQLPLTTVILVTGHAPMMLLLYVKYAGMTPRARLLDSRRMDAGTNLREIRPPKLTTTPINLFLKRRTISNCFS